MAITGNTGSHYRIQAVCRVPGAHGKGNFPHGKMFAVCCSRQTIHGKQTSAKGTFAECFSSRTRQKFCRVLKLALGKHFPKTKKQKKSVGPTSPLPHAGTSSSPPSERPLRCRRGPRPVVRASSAAGVAAAAPARGVPPLPHTRWPAPSPPSAHRRCCRHPPAAATAAIRLLWLLPPPADAGPPPWPC